MKTSNIRSLGALLFILATCVLFPTEARADAINFGFVAVSTGHWWGGNDWGASLSHDTNQIVQAYAMPGLGSHLRITHNGTTFVVADNPGLLKLGNRGFNDVCLLANGQELVFDDHHDIYLVNIEQRKVGRVVEGAKFITISPRYQRQMRNANNGTEPIR